MDISPNIAVSRLNFVLGEVDSQWVTMLRHLARCRKVFHSKDVRFLSDGTCGVTDGERKIEQVLKSKFPGAKTVSVEDISGGCGAMFEVSIEATEFQGKRTVKQHMMVNEEVYMIFTDLRKVMFTDAEGGGEHHFSRALKEEIQAMHGLRINTKVPS